MASILRVLAVLLAGTAAADEVDLSLPEARALAVQAVLAGDHAAAREVAAALLRGDPDDRAALVVLAAAEPRLGRPGQGRMAAVRAWRLSGTEAGRYEAARLAALAAAGEERWWLAGWWLRRALDAAPSEAEAARTAADARALRDRQAWRAEVALSFGPSENVNGGAEDARNVVDGLPVVGIISIDGQALSGFAGTAEATVTRRLHGGEASRTAASLRLWGRGVALSEESRNRIEAAGADGVTGADFGAGLAEARLRHDRAVARAVAGVEAVAGATWFGGELGYHHLRLGADASWGLEAGALRVGGFAERRWHGGREDDRLGVTAAWTMAAGPGALTLSLGRSATLSENRNADGGGWSAGARWAPEASLGPARLSVGVTAQATAWPDYAVLFAVPGGRRDERVGASVEASFPGWGRMGFEPVVTLEASRTDSNVGRFAGDGVGVSFGLRSSF